MGQPSQYKQERKARLERQRIRLAKQEAENPGSTIKLSKKDKKAKKKAEAAGREWKPYKKMAKALLPVGDASRNSKPFKAEEDNINNSSKKRKAVEDELEQSDVKARGKDEKRKSKKPKTEMENPAIDTSAPSPDTTLQQDFIRFDDPSAEDPTSHAPTNGTISRKGSKKIKKDKSSKNKKSDNQEEFAAETNGVDASSQAVQEADDTQPAATKKDRFIVFVGNLPYSATKEELQTHFSKVEPKDIRIGTDKKTNKPKGFAFVEFDRFDRMETCLKKFNHSVFPDGKDGRKINIELTAGGGGNNSSRKSKIQAKNDKLHEERQRDREKRAEVEEKQKERKEKKEARQDKGKKDEPSADAEESSQAHDGIHPSRLAMMQKPASSGRQPNRFRY